jgi:hypothetical protein
LIFRVEKEGPESSRSARKGSATTQDRNHLFRLIHPEKKFYRGLVPKLQKPADDGKGVLLRREPVEIRIPEERAQRFGETILFHSRLFTLSVENRGKINDILYQMSSP